MNDTQPFKLVGNEIHWTLSNKKGFDIIAELNDGYLCVDDKNMNSQTRYIPKSQIELPKDTPKL